MKKKPPVHDAQHKESEIKLNGNNSSATNI